MIDDVAWEILDSLCSEVRGWSQRDLAIDTGFENEEVCDCVDWLLSMSLITEKNPLPNGTRMFTYTPQGKGTHGRGRPHLSPKDEARVRFGQNVEKFMKLTGLSQRGLAKILGISTDTLGRIIRAENTRKESRMTVAKWLIRQVRAF